jgi:hypothetical protein
MKIMILGPGFLIVHVVAMPPTTVIVSQKLGHGRSVDRKMMPKNFAFIQKTYSSQSQHLAGDIFQIACPSLRGNLGIMSNKFTKEIPKFNIPSWY